MKYCEQCQVYVDNPTEHCPLCFSGLRQADNHPEPPAYPMVFRQVEQYHLMFRLLLMLSLTVAVVCIIINLMTNRETLWSLVVVGNIVYMWVAIGAAVRRWTKVGFNVLVQALSLSGLLLLIDGFTGYHGWALDYVIPFLLMTATLCVTLLSIIRRMDAKKFILYLFLTALTGLIPIVLYALGLVKVMWPSLVCAVYSLLSLIGMFVFADRYTKQELKKRFHL